MKNMKKKKFMLGVLFVITGGIMTIFFMVSGIISIAGSMYEDIESFHLELSTSDKEIIKTKNFIQNLSNDLSVWYRYDSRSVENKDFIIEGSLNYANGDVISTFEEDFNIGYSRNSAGSTQYYKLGDINVNDIKDEELFISYITKGNWMIESRGLLVLREHKGTFFPILEAIFFLLSNFIIILGIGTIKKNR